MFLREIFATFSSSQPRERARHVANKGYIICWLVYLEGESTIRMTLGEILQIWITGSRTGDFLVRSCRIRTMKLRIVTNVRMVPDNVGASCSGNQHSSRLSKRRLREDQHGRYQGKSRLTCWFNSTFSVTLKPGVKSPRCTWTSKRLIMPK